MHPVLITDLPEETLLTTTELGRMWGSSSRHILDLIYRGDLGYCDLAKEGAERRRIRIPVSEARKYIQSRTVRARISA